MDFVQWISCAFCGVVSRRAQQTKFQRWLMSMKMKKKVSKPDTLNVKTVKALAVSLFHSLLRIIFVAILRPKSVTFHNFRY